MGRFPCFFLCVWVFYSLLLFPSLYFYTRSHSHFRVLSQSFPPPPDPPRATPPPEVSINTAVKGREQSTVNCLGSYFPRCIFRAARNDDMFPRFHFFFSLTIRGSLLHIFLFSPLPSIWPLPQGNKAFQRPFTFLYRNFNWFPSPLCIFCCGSHF